MDPSRLLVAMALVLWTASITTADERPLIWEFSKSSDTSYLAKVGSRLPSSMTSSIGADIRMRGPDPERFGNPLLLWGTLWLAEPSGSEGRTTRVDATLDGDNGVRRISLSNAVSASLAHVDAQLDQQFTFDYNPRADDELRARMVQSLRLSVPRTHTVVSMSAWRNAGEEWRTRIGVEQPLRGSISLGASIENPARDHRKSRFRASYRHSW